MPIFHPSYTDRSFFTPSFTSTTCTDRKNRGMAQSVGDYGEWRVFVFLKLANARNCAVVGDCVCRRCRFQPSYTDRSFFTPSFTSTTCTVETRYSGTTNICKTKSCRCQNSDTRLY
jgi:hypothetical protein